MRRTVSLASIAQLKPHDQHPELIPIWERWWFIVGAILIALALILRFGI